MLTTSGVFSGMSVRDVPEAVSFWRETVGLEVVDGPAAFLLLPGGGRVLL